MHREKAFQFQYLGMSGDTFSCLEAIITTLRSPKPPSHYTVVIADWSRRIEDHTKVLFIAWDWIGTQVTIIPDGFGTHAGTGGWGLSMALALIQSSGQRIEEVIVPQVVFERIVKGKPTQKDISILGARQSGSSWWEVFVRTEHEKGIKDGTVWGMSRISNMTESLPKWGLSSDTFVVSRTFDVDPKGAVTSVLTKLEDTVRRLSGASRGSVGVKLMGDAFGKEGKLRFKREVEDEADGWASLFRGIFSAVRNPLSHHESPLSKDEAVRYILICDLLFRKLREETQSEHDMPPNSDDVINA